MKINTESEKENRPLYPIGIVAELIGITEQTLRLYEKHGLIKPARRNKNRYFSDNDIKWLSCVRDLIHSKKISIEGIKKLLSYAPCWEITECSEETRAKCTAFVNKTRPCWELSRARCGNNKLCEDCIVFLAGEKRKKAG
jgi:MerR family transcriptional regulator/heat shock protein HspR